MSSKRGRLLIGVAVAALLAAGIAAWVMAGPQNCAYCGDSMASHEYHSVCEEDNVWCTECEPPKCCFYPPCTECPKCHKNIFPLPHGLHTPCGACNADSVSPVSPYCCCNDLCIRNCDYCGKCLNHPTHYPCPCPNGYWHTLGACPSFGCPDAPDGWCIQCRVHWEMGGCNDEW
jgi:hypothetical protein